MAIAALRPNRAAPRRPFTSPALVDRDLGILTAMLEDLRSLVYSGAEIVPYRKINRKAYGLRRRAIVCRLEPLLELDALYVAGFFAWRKQEVDITELDRANQDVVRRFPEYPEILSYSTWELSTNNWVNFIVADCPDFAEKWRECPAHTSAVDRFAHVHYRNVRIHGGRIPGGLGGGRRIVLERTKYWDYEVRPTWMGVRELNYAPA